MNIHEILSKLNWELILAVYNKLGLNTYLDTPVTIKAITTDLTELINECIEEDILYINMSPWRIQYSNEVENPFLVVEFIPTDCSNIDGVSFDQILEQRLQIALNQENYELVQKIKDKYCL